MINSVSRLDDLNKDKFINLARLYGHCIAPQSKGAMMRGKSLILGSSALTMPFIASGAYAYANTLTRLIPDLYAGLDVVSRELVGFVPSVNRNTGVERAAVGQAVVWPVAPEQGTFVVTPAMTIPEPADKTVGNGTMTLTRSEGVEFGWTGEEQRGLNSGPGYTTVQADLFAQGLRTLVNMIERDVAIAATAGASRAVGVAGTTPFSGTDLEDAALVRQVLDDNGAPPSDRSLIINTAAGVKMRKHVNLAYVDHAGTTMTLRQGELLPLFGLSVKESAQTVRHVAGTGAAATTNATGYAVGARTITLASAGTGTIKVGDVISFAGDDNKYVVTAGDTDVSNGGTITIAAPGLREAIPAAATAITVSGDYSANVAFSRNAIGLAVRPPALPQEGDAAIDSMIITDPRSGMSFEIRVYAGYRKIRAEVAATWGAGVIKPEHVALLLG